MTEKRYLKWYNKVGYGSGDIAGNVVYLVIPFALDAIITFILSRMKVEEANEQLRAAV